MMKIAVIDYGMGNIGSICNMLKHIGVAHIVSSDVAEIQRCDKIILPGVGHFELAMQNLEQRDLVAPLKEMVLQRKKPILGICLGMQLLCKTSEEASRKGLGLINATVRRFEFEPGSALKIPHMGWSDVDIVRPNSLSTDLGQEPRFYFVHSYYVDCQDESDIVGLTHYGRNFVSAFLRDNIAGVQFHPEKSHKYGIQLFRNFLGKHPA